MMYQKKTIRDNKQAAFSHRWTISVLWTVLLMCCALGVRAQSFTLQGKVSDTNGNPIELASVMVVSQGKLAMTNLKGEFSLELHSADSVAVRFSMVGYRTKTRVLRRPRGRQTILSPYLASKPPEENPTEATISGLMTERPSCCPLRTRKGR